MNGLLRRRELHERAGFRRRSRWGRGTTWSGGFLVATLALALWLAYQAADAARSHREAAESAVRDYAQVAAWQYARLAGEELDEFLEALFDEVPRRVRARLPEPREVRRDVDDALERVGCECPALLDPPVVFRLDLRTGEALARPDTIAPARLARLADTLAAAAAADNRRRGLLFVPANLLLPAPAAIAWAVLTDSLGPALAYGVAFEATSFGAVFQRWYERGQLLPAAITRGLPNDSLLHLAVRAPGGAVLFHSALPARGAVTAADSLRRAHGRLVVAAEVRPDAVSRLVIGGLPTSRLPLILGLLVLTLGVGAAALLQLRRERALTRLREDFISGVSHELRTPLAQIRMFAELQEAGKLRSEGERARAVSVINREAQRLTHLVENILRFSRLRYTTERSAVREPIVVADMVAQVLEGFRSLAAARRMTLHTELEPATALLASRDALHQVLVNLLDNAVKYGPAGQTITVAAGRSEAYGWITVTDQGPGVPTAERARIWEPYLRLQRDVDARVPGTGIGLAVVAQLVAADGGCVLVEDAPGGGARFVVQLPAAAASTAHGQRAAAAEVSA